MDQYREYMTEYHTGPIPDFKHDRAQLDSCPAPAKTKVPQGHRCYHVQNSVELGSSWDPARVQPPRSLTCPISRQAGCQLGVDY